MPVFELHAANHAGHLVNRAERCWPVGDGKSCIIAGDERSGHNQNKRDARREHGKSVKATIVCRGDGLQSETPWSRETCALRSTRVQAPRVVAMWEQRALGKREIVSDVDYIPPALNDWSTVF